MSVLKTILDKRFFSPWIEGETDDPSSIWADANLELYVTAQCNQNCEYCYLVRHEELYPRDVMKPDIIKKNLHIFLDWCMDQGFSFNQVDFFSGEIWHSQFGWDLLDIMLSYIRNGLRVKTVMIPTNASFILSDRACIEMTNRIEDYRNAGCLLQLSGSIDGGYIDNITRRGNDDHLTDDKNSDEFYEKFFSFWRHHNYLFHPMVSSANVKYWKDNFQWWDDQCKRYGYDAFSDVMMLEVRNDDWTDASINDYTDFLDFLIDKYLDERCNGNVSQLVQYLFLTDIFNPGGNGYINFGMTQADAFQGCTVSDMFTVRLGDLAIPPCHRTAYDDLLYGKFHVEDGKITDIDEINPQIASRILLQDSILCSPGCDRCAYNAFCLRGCYGSQREIEKDPFMPIESVCKMFRAKIDFLIDKFDKLGVWKYLEILTPANARYESIQDTLNSVKRIQEVRAK